MRNLFNDVSENITPVLDNKVDISSIGVANGVAGLDSNGLIPSSQLPSYVDDVLEYSSLSNFPATGVTGKIYVALDTNKTYRWGGSTYTEISESLSLGTTSSTAYRGDLGKEAYDHSQSDHSGIIPTFTEASTRANIATGESIATIFGKIKKFFSDLKAVAFSGSYNDLANKPTIPSALADLTTDNAKGAVRYGKTWGSTLGYSFDKDGLIIDQRQDESSGVQFNGDYVAFWAPADGYCMRFFDEDNSNEIWNIDANGKFSGTIDWARVNGSNQALKMKGWWASGSSNNADNLNNGSVFAYAASHNTPTTGPLFAFASEDGNKYVAQVQFQYNGDAVYHRVKNGDNNTWRSWVSFKSQADVDSAYSSGFQQRVDTIWNGGDVSSRSAFNVTVGRGLSSYSHVFIYGRLASSVSGYYAILGGFNPSALTKISVRVGGRLYNNVIARLSCYGTKTFIRLIWWQSDNTITITKAYDEQQDAEAADTYMIPIAIYGVRK